MVAGAQFQSEQRYGISLAIILSPDIILLLSALAVAVTGGRVARPPLLVWTAGFVIVTAWAWSVLFQERHRKPHRRARGTARALVTGSDVRRRRGQFLLLTALYPALWGLARLDGLLCRQPGYKLSLRARRTG